MFHGVCPDTSGHSSSIRVLKCHRGALGDSLFHHGTNLVEENEGLQDNMFALFMSKVEEKLKGRGKGGTPSTSV